MQMLSWSWTMPRLSLATASSCPCTQLCCETCLADLPARQHNEKLEIPLADFTECSALLGYLYCNGVSCKGAAFEDHSKAARDAATAVARFAHTYDAPHALRHVEAYLAAFLDARFRNKTTLALCKSTKTSDIYTWRDVLSWAVMADNFGMHELCGQCERGMMMYWEEYHDAPELVDQLSSSALQRIAKGLSRTLLSEREARAPQGHKYPSVRDFIAWRAT